MREEKEDRNFQLKFNVFPHLRIVDITFARTDMDEIVHYGEMSESKKKIKLIEYRILSEKNKPKVNQVHIDKLEKEKDDLFTKL